MTKHDPTDSVTATLCFRATTDEKPVALVDEPGQVPEVPDTGSETVDHDVVIKNARAIARQLDLDRQGFVLMPNTTAVQDFYDEDEVRRVYYPETEALIRSVTGACKVVIFDYTIRVDDEDMQARLNVRGPVKGAHIDVNPSAAQRLVREWLPADEAEARLGKRFSSINVWRPIRGPVETGPLAICEYESIDDQDLVASELHYPGGHIAGIYNLVHNPKQRWYYFPRMERDEVVLLKCFDSLMDGTARWAAHLSFEDPNSPANAMPRESIEVRALVFFD